MHAHRRRGSGLLDRGGIGWIHGICAFLMTLFLVPPGHAEDFYIAGDWRCNLRKVSQRTPGNKTIRIEQDTNKIALIGDSGAKSVGRFAGPYELSTPGWEYGNSGRLGINVDGTFYGATDAIAKFSLMRDYEDWNFIQWESGMICSTSSAALAAGREMARKTPPPQGLR